MIMQLRADPSDPLPLYAQLMAQLRRGIAAGEFPPGAQLPTVRHLAVELAINPNTVGRAYSELEREGLIATRQGRGTFVVGTPGPPAPGERTARLEAVITEALAQASALGCDPREFCEAVQRHVQRGAAQR